MYYHIIYTRLCFPPSLPPSPLSLPQYPVPDAQFLKSSNIGKAVMLIYKHPKETRKNKEKAGKIISK